MCITTLSDSLSHDQDPVVQSPISGNPGLTP